MNPYGDRRYLWAALLLMAAFMVGDVVVAFVSGSLALLSDAGHMLSDVCAIGASLWAISLAARPATGVWTFGWKRAEILSAAGNGITLLVVSGIGGYEAIRRLLDPPPVEGEPVLVVGLVGEGKVSEGPGVWSASEFSEHVDGEEAGEEHGAEQCGLGLFVGFDE